MRPLLIALIMCVCCLALGEAQSQEINNYNERKIIFPEATSVDIKGKSRPTRDKSQTQSKTARQPASSSKKSSQTQSETQTTRQTTTTTTLSQPVVQILQLQPVRQQTQQQQLSENPVRTVDAPAAYYQNNYVQQQQPTVVIQSQPQYAALPIQQAVPVTNWSNNAVPVTQTNAMFGQSQPATTSVVGQTQAGVVVQTTTTVTKTTTFYPNRGAAQQQQPAVVVAQQPVATQNIQPTAWTNNNGVAQPLIYGQQQPTVVVAQAQPQYQANQQVQQNIPTTSWSNGNPLQQQTTTIYQQQQPAVIVQQPQQLNGYAPVATTLYQAATQNQPTQTFVTQQTQPQLQSPPVATVITQLQSQPQQAQAQGILQSSNGQQTQFQQSGSSSTSGTGSDWFTPHQPSKNHYRDFVAVFSDIDRRAEQESGSTANQDDDADSTDDDFSGRSVAAPGQYPHMSALGFRTTGNDITFKCGGSLISEMYVLTAAHCCSFNGLAPSIVKIGDINLKHFDADNMPQRRRVSGIQKHPLYKPTLYYHDIALIKLDRAIRHTKFVRPIRLWARHEIPYEKVFTMGYGSTSFGKAPTNILTEMDLSIVPLTECNRTLHPDENAPHGILDSQICAKDFELNRDTCQGDSGGPLQLNLERKKKSKRLRYYLVGIISYGTFCRSPHPGVYTRVSSYIDWIASIVWPELLNN